MKKFYKFVGITAGILFGLGIVLAITGGIFGAKGAIAFSKEHGFQIIDDVEIWEHKDMNIEMIKSIYIDTKTADVDIIRTKDSRFGVDISLMGDDSSIKYENNDGVLTIKDNGNAFGFVINLFAWEALAENKVTIYVPEDYNMEQVEIMCAVGDVDIKDIQQIDTLVIKADVGDVEIRDGIYKSLKIDAAVGDVTMEDIEVNELLTVRTDVGDIDIAGRLKCNVDVSTNVGDIDIEHGMSNKDYNYKITANAGDIDAFGEDVEGLNGELKGNAGAQYTMNISTDLGSVDVK